MTRLSAAGRDAIRFRIICSAEDIGNLLRSLDAAEAEIAKLLPIADRAEMYRAALSKTSSYAKLIALIDALWPDDVFHNWQDSGPQITRLARQCAELAQAKEAAEAEVERLRAACSVPAVGRVRFGCIVAGSMQPNDLNCDLIPRPEL